MDGEDRDLLIQAARAANIDIFWAVTGGYELRSGGVWNPLADDGDTLRLAAALLIDIEWETEFIVFACGNFSEDIKDHGNDRAAAIRRAVVRAAAFEDEDQ